MWRIFNTEAEALAYADVAAEARLPCGPGDVTTIWDVPRQLTNGRWVVMSLNGDGIEWADDWHINEPDTAINGM